MCLSPAPKLQHTLWPEWVNYASQRSRRASARSLGRPCAQCIPCSPVDATLQSHEQRGFGDERRAHGRPTWPAHMKIAPAPCAAPKLQRSKREVVVQHSVCFRGCEALSRSRRRQTWSEIREERHTTERHTTSEAPSPTKPGDKCCRACRNVQTFIIPSVFAPVHLLTVLGLLWHAISITPHLTLPLLASSSLISRWPFTIDGLQWHLAQHLRPTKLSSSVYQIDVCPLSERPT